MMAETYARGEWPKIELGQTRCNGCGQTVTVKQNKNGGAYYRCQRLVEDDDGNATWCGHQEQWGKVGTAKLKARLAKPANSPAAPKPKPSLGAPAPAAANDNAPPRRPAAANDNPAPVRAQAKPAKEAKDNDRSPIFGS